MPLQLFFSCQAATASPVNKIKNVEEVAQARQQKFLAESKPGVLEKINVVHGEDAVSLKDLPSSCEEILSHAEQILQIKSDIGASFTAMVTDMKKAHQTVEIMGIGGWLLFHAKKVGGQVQYKIAMAACIPEDVNNVALAWALMQHVLPELGTHVASPVVPAGVPCGQEQLTWTSKATLHECQLAHNACVAMDPAVVHATATCITLDTRVRRGIKTQDLAVVGEHFLRAVESRVVVPPHIRQGLLLQLQQEASHLGDVAIMAQLQLEGGQALLAAKPAATGCVDVAHSIALSRPAGDIDGSVLSWRMMSELQNSLCSEART